MDSPSSLFPPWMLTSKFVVNLASAVFGMLGTWMISRRYASEFLRSIFFALSWPILALFMQGHRVRDYFRRKIIANRDVTDSVVDMVVGVNLLFWAFFLQLAGIVIDARH
jgi:hypothetical protein